IHEPPLPTRVQSAVYQVTLLDPVSPEVVQARVSELLRTPSIPCVRRGKSFDLRPLIENIQFQVPRNGGMMPLGGMMALCMQLAAREGATGRADEILEKIGVSIYEVRIERTQLLLAG
ncbi:MAG: hypothetical protein U1B80_06105, partial [Anaerolineaceae bacterium]|nr:hypothetical protein [Anaerolineaceae bacterium]